MSSYEMAMAANGSNMSHLASAAHRSIRKKKLDKAAAVDTGVKKWEVDRSKLSDMREIGSGNFGKVFLAVAQGLVKGQDKTPVAVKTLTSSGKEAESDFLAEVSIMQQIDGPHHIVRLLGVCTDAKPMYMIMEFMARGDLKEVLRHARPKNDQPSELTAAKMAKMCSDIAEGMAYLAKSHIVHRDLAARNCLVDDSYTVKVGDFGLTRDVYHVEYYRMTGAAALPIRWMSPESLNDGVFSSASDVWSFGITMWEVVTFGKQPYPELENNRIVEAICDEDYRMACPDTCPQAFYAIMRKCWEEEPEDRPTFDTLYQELMKLVPKLSEKPVAKLAASKKAEKKSASAPTYQVPQDSIGFNAEDSAEEEEYKPYGLTDIDMSTYSLVGGERRAGSSAAKAGGEEGDAYQLASRKTSKDAKPAAAPFYDLASPRTAPAAAAPAAARPVSPKEEKPYVRRGATTAVTTTEVTSWLEGVVGKKKPDGQSLQQWLKSGEVLCDAINAKKPGTISKVNRGSTRAFMQMENIAHFLDACTKIGLSSRERFETVDLFEDDNMTSVVNCLTALRVALG